MPTKKNVGYRSLKPNCVKPSEPIRYSRMSSVFSAALQTIFDESVFDDNHEVSHMQMALALIGQKVVMRKLRRIILKMGLIYERKRRSKGMSKATTGIQEQENLIRQDFSEDKPHTKILTDVFQI